MYSAWDYVQGSLSNKRKQTEQGWDALRQGTIGIHCCRSDFPFWVYIADVLSLSLSLPLLPLSFFTTLLIQLQQPASANRLYSLA